ncbi:MAG: class I mannose-6-phosphate isomerase [Opitutaceae bacterium]
MSHRGKIVQLPPNRVWRTYDGGRCLDELAGIAPAADGPMPEDWVASTTRATNPGRETMNEGPSHVVIAGETLPLLELLENDPDYFLGASHLKRFGTDPRMLVKLLDPSIRLHLQVHPTADFAQRHLQAASGKTEAYHILSVRPETADPAIYLGFHTPPKKSVLKDWIETQNIPELLAAMNRVPVKSGDTLLVPGGVPHALGEGLLLVEIQEPSDLVVRFEFSRGGRILPESARFMGRSLDFCLEIFDLSAWTPERVQREACCRPVFRREIGPGSRQNDLIGPTQTPCFNVRQSRLTQPCVKNERSLHLLFVTAGSCVLEAGGERLSLQFGQKVLLPSGLGPVAFTPTPTCTLLECHPPHP